MFAFFVYYSYLYNSNRTIMDFIKILELVESGVPISRALESLKISRSSFYKAITEQQKRLLDEAHPLMDNPLLGDDLFGIPGHKQTLHLRADLPQPLDQEASVHLRHDDIGNEEVNLPLELRRDAESLARARGA